MRKTKNTGSYLSGADLLDMTDESEAHNNEMWGLANEKGCRYHADMVRGSNRVSCTSNRIRTSIRNLI